MYRYTAYELDVASELELPELVAAEGTPSGPPDLTIRLGEVPDEIEGGVAFWGQDTSATGGGAPTPAGDGADPRPYWTVSPDAWLQEVDDVGRYYVHNRGTEVVIERTGGSDVALRCFLFGTVLGAIFHQRRQFVLHACAVSMPGGAVALAGNPRAGKSTTMATLLTRGHELLSDDKTVLRPGPDGPEVLSGYPTMRLWGDAAERMGLDASELPELLPGMGKYLYRTPAFRREATPLRALVVLTTPRPVDKGGPEDIGGVQVRPLASHRAVQTLLRQTYRRPILNGLGLQGEHFAWATKLGNTIPIVRVVRPRTGDTVTEVADAVEAVVASATATPA